MKIAAIQINAVLADIEKNLQKSELLISEAVKAGAELVLLPEFFASAIGFTQQMLDVPIKGKEVKEKLKQWATSYRMIIGGSYLFFDGKESCNVFELVFPSGEVFGHKKDIPTQFENCYYTNGDESNVFYTPIGNIGVALCWEMIRYDTVKRIMNNVDVVLAGSCWWDLPKDAPPNRDDLRSYNQNLAAQTPVTFAKLLRVPVVHANHCGEVTALNFPKADKLQTMQLVGATQIIGSHGEIIVKKPFSDGAGFAMSDISWDKNKRKRVKSPSKRYWIPDLPDEYINAWENANPKGKHYYETVALPYYKRRGE